MFFLQGQGDDEDDQDWQVLGSWPDMPLGSNYASEEKVKLCGSSQKLGIKASFQNANEALDCNAYVSSIPCSADTLAVAMTKTLFNEVSFWNTATGTFAR
jgi:hypothetical protein